MSPTVTWQGTKIYKMFKSSKGDKNQSIIKFITNFNKEIFLKWRDFTQASQEIPLSFQKWQKEMS
jgi:hypothetical protein